MTTAYELGKRGFKVTVLERKELSGAETSFANGGQLSYSHAEPWASPHVLAKLPFWAFDPNAPLVLKPRADWEMIKWGLQFLRNCTHARAKLNCITMLRLGMYSKQEMARIKSETNIDFAFSGKGIVHIYGNDKDFDHARQHNDFQAKFGCEQRVLTREETLALEPSLQHTERTIVGGLHAHMDESGDAHQFCNALAKVAAERHGVQFKYGITIDRLVGEKDRIVAVKTDHGDFTADGFVMAMGSYSRIYLRDIGIAVPIYPMKGYSITLDANDYCPTHSITDGQFKIVYSRLADKLRIAGTAEFAGYNQDINMKRIAPIVKAAKGLLPKANWDGAVDHWGCIRPSTPDGPPIMGRSPYRNLFLNTGHGTLGWTQAAGSATIVADLMENKNPAILLQGMTLR